MTQKTLSIWLKVAVIVLSFIGLAAYALILPSYAVSMKDQYPEFADRFVPWLLFLTLTAIPYYAALTFCFLLSVNIGRGQSFSLKSAKYLRWIMIDSAVASAYFFTGNLVLALMNMSHPGILIMSFLIVLLCFALSIGAAVLSHLVMKAAAIKDENDLTI